MQGGADRARRSDPDGPRSPISVHDLLARHARPAAPDERPQPGAAGSPQRRRPAAQNGQPGATRAAERPAPERAGEPPRRAAPIANGSTARTPPGRSDGPTRPRSPQPGRPPGDHRPGRRPRARPGGRRPSDARRTPAPGTRDSATIATPAARPGARPGPDAPRTNGHRGRTPPDRRRRPTGPGQPSARIPTSDTRRTAPIRRGARRVDRPHRAPTPGRPRRARPATRPGTPRPVRPARTSPAAGPDAATVAIPRDTAVAAPTGPATARTAADRTPTPEPAGAGAGRIEADDLPDASDLDVLEIRPRRRLPKARMLAGLLALAVFGATAYGWGGKAWLGSGIAQVAALEPEFRPDRRRGRAARGHQRVDRGRRNGAGRRRGHPRGGARPGRGRLADRALVPARSGDQPAGVHGLGPGHPLLLRPAGAGRRPRAAELGVRGRRPAVRHPRRAAAERHRDHRLPRHRREPDRTRSRTPSAGWPCACPGRWTTACWARSRGSRAGPR